MKGTIPMSTRDRPPPVYALTCDKEEYRSTSLGSVDEWYLPLERQNTWRNAVSTPDHLSLRVITIRIPRNGNESRL